MLPSPRNQSSRKRLRLSPWLVRMRKMSLPSHLRNQSPAVPRLNTHRPPEILLEDLVFSQQLNAAHKHKKTRKRIKRNLTSSLKMLEMSVFPSFVLLDAYLNQPFTVLLSCTFRKTELDRAKKVMILELFLFHPMLGRHSPHLRFNSGRSSKIIMIRSSSFKRASSTSCTKMMQESDTSNLT